MTKKKLLLAALLCMAFAAMALAGCAGGGSQSSANSTSESSAATDDSSVAAGDASTDAVSAGIPDGQATTVRLGFIPSSGHVLSGIAEDKGYYADEGIEVEYVTFSTADEAFSSLAAGKVDVLSTYGTNIPLQYVDAGENISIVSGYMLEGAMTYVAQPETEFTGAESFVGKILAGTGPVSHQTTGPLLDLGFDPINDVEWLILGSHTDRMEAVRTGKADFAMLATGVGQQAEENGLKIVAYCSDLMPDYCCCRGVANNDWLDSNPATIKAMLKAWIRALGDFQADREAAVPLIAKQIDMPEDYVAWYALDEEHFTLQVDPAWTAVKRAWDIDKKTGIVTSDDSVLKEHFRPEYYKQALDECIDQYYDENASYYDAALAYYEENDVIQ